MRVASNFFRRAIVPTAAIALVSLPSIAGKVESEIESRWRGAWVVLRAEVGSNCDGRYTDNRINGWNAAGRGRTWFKHGEVAKIDNLNVHRSRIDVRMSISERLRVDRPDGPFVLYDYVSCRVEFEIEVPREAIRERDYEEIDEIMGLVLDRYRSSDEARRAEAWNGRTAEPLPDDYDRTLFEHAVWRAETHNESVDDGISSAYAELGTISRAIGGDLDYSVGLSQGMAFQRNSGQESCGFLFGASFSDAPPRDALPASDDWIRGFRDGRSLVHYLSVVSKGPDCYVEVPQEGTALTDRAEAR